MSYTTIILPAIRHHSRLVIVHGGQNMFPLLHENEYQIRGIGNYLSSPVASSYHYDMFPPGSEA